jgi:hypothetical protein
MTERTETELYFLNGTFYLLFFTFVYLVTLFILLLFSLSKNFSDAENITKTNTHVVLPVIILNRRYLLYLGLNPLGTRSNAENA